jgi:hypothetical protein
MPNGVPALESAQYIVLRSIEQRERKPFDKLRTGWQKAAGRKQRAADRFELRRTSGS